MIVSRIIRERVTTKAKPGERVCEVIGFPERRTMDFEGFM
jgi:hypothetical protein